MIRLVYDLKKNWPKLLKDIVTIILGVGSLWWSVVKFGREKAAKDALLITNGRLEEELREKNLLLSEIMVRVSIDSYDIEDIPFPMGYKVFDSVERTFRMVRVNNAYKKKYSVSNARYFGQKDEKVDEVNSSIWLMNDLSVMESPEKTPFRFYEPSKLGIGSWRKWWLEKNGNRYLYFLEI